MKEEEAYDELLEERRYLRRQVELINQWNEQGVLNERMAAERKEESVERGVNRQRESWREQEFLLRYEATYLAFRESAARFERWMAEGGLAQMEANLKNAGFGEPVVNLLKDVVQTTPEDLSGIKEMNAIVQKGDVPSSLVAGVAKINQAINKFSDAITNLPTPPTTKDVGNVIFTQGEVSLARQEQRENAENEANNPKNSYEAQASAKGVNQNLEQTKAKDMRILQALDNACIQFGYKPFSKMTEQEFQKFKRDLDNNPELQRTYMNVVGINYGNVNYQDFLEQGEMAKHYKVDGYKEKIYDAINAFNAQTNSNAPAAGPITAYAEYDNKIKQALNIALKELAVETTEKALNGNLHDYAVVSMIDPTDPSKRIKTFIEKSGNDYDLGGYGVLMGKKLNEMLERDNYKGLSDTDYYAVTTHLLFTFVDKESSDGKNFVIGEHKNQTKVNDVNITLAKMTALSEVIKKNGDLAQLDEMAENFRYLLSEALKEEYGDTYGKSDELLSKVVEGGVESMLRGEFNSKDFYDMSDRLQKEYKNENQNEDIQTAILSNKTNDDSKALEEMNNNYSFS